MSHFRNFCAGLVICCLSVRAEFKPGTEGKKLISYGQDYPNPAYLRANIREMEKHPFDGVVIGLSSEREPKLGAATLGNMAWSKTKYDAKDYEHGIEDLKATKFEKFTDNFIQLESMPGEVDFFDDNEWAGVVNNFTILARAAKLGGCVGIEFDPEEYGDAHVWTYAAWPMEKRKGRSEEQYVDKARRRGDELMRAINREFPKIKILFLMGPALTWNQSHTAGHGYKLLAPFIEGMCKAADDGSEIIDGYEQSYGYRIEPAFARARDVMQRSRELFADKSAFDRVMRKGFGLWNDNGSGQLGWHPDDPEKNHFQPNTYQTAVHGALSYTDKYVWVWRERFNEWTGENLSAAYDDAMRNGRRLAGPASGRKAPPPEIVLKHMADTGPRDDFSTFGDLTGTYTVLIDLTKASWKFWLDPDDIGVKEKWFAANVAKGEPIEIGKFWEEQGWDYDGVAWYRTEFQIDKLPKNRVKLFIGAADETVAVWLNGEKVGGQDIGELGWDQRVAIDLTGKLREGKNDLAIRVFDSTGPGGLWKPIKIFEAKNSIAGKKLIEYGTDVPEPRFIRAHIREMEKMPFDGIVIRIPKPSPPGVRGPSIGRHAFAREKFQPEDYEHAVVDLKATKFEKFTDNFIQILSSPGDVDWYDPAWESIVFNTRILTRIAKETGCVGIMFDPEEYGFHLWTYAELPAELRQKHSEKEYIAKVRERGEEWIRAINAEFPNIKILGLFGATLSNDERIEGQPSYSLLAPFIEGICRGADAGTTYTDGFEQSYGYVNTERFDEGRQRMFDARQLFEDRTACDRVLRCGFGLWIDHDSHKQPWDTKDFSKNHFKPQAWKKSVHEALVHTDEYVWVYCQALNWWTIENLPVEYVNAQREAR